MLLSELQTREQGIIVKVKGRGPFRKRITEMGFVKGQRVKVIKNAPLLDPVEYSIMGYEVSLRRTEASLIEVVSEHEFKEDPNTFGLQNYDEVSETVRKEGKTINIALTGNPNSGKTSIFNHLSNSREHVGNYGGVTIETKLARIEYQGYTLNIFDLPGTYSITSYSPEEIYVRNFLTENQPDIVVNVVDAANLERNLYLTTQLIDMNVKVVIALNMYDELQKKGDRFNYHSFGNMCGIPIVPTVGSRGKGLVRLFEAIISKHKEQNRNRKGIHIHYGEEIELSVKRLQNVIREEESNHHLTDRICARYIALKLLEEDEHTLSLIKTAGNYTKIKKLLEKERKRLQELHYENPETLITDARFGFISGALRETYSYSNIKRRKISDKIDDILTHKYLGIPIFFAFLWLMFTSTFKIGQYPVEWIEHGISWLSTTIHAGMPAGDLRDMLVDGILGGVGGVIVFLPNILILFFFIAFLEDSGYMARAAFIMDKVMHRIGLHGKSFIPLIMGFGCNVPAIMSTRIIESRNNRLLTMLIVPFMSCSARLPVYILFISAFFPSYQGTVLFGIYLTGILLAVLTALFMKRMFFKKTDSPFVMELPPYRIPTVKNMFRHMWNKGYQYLHKIGGVILIASIIIWALEYYPQNSKILSGNKEKIPALTAMMPSHSLTAHKKTENNRIELQKKEENSDSYIKRIGKSVEPVMEPLGFDWKMTVSLMAGVAGKEIVVSTFGVLYDDHEMKKNVSLGERIRTASFDAGPEAGKQKYSPAIALAYLIFILVYFPCIAVIATITRESGSFWWGMLMIFYTTGLAWILAFLTKQAGTLLFG